MAQLYPVAGSKLFIGSAVAGKGTVTAADFTGETWTEVGGWASAGSIGDTQEVGEQSLINENRMRKFKTMLNGGTMENTFVPMALDPGQIKFKEAISDCKPYRFKIEWGGDCAPQSAVSVSVASPGVVSWTAHGLAAGQPVVFSVDDTGALPTGLLPDVVYYVVETGITDDSFSVATTAGGTAIVTTGSPSSATVTATAPPAGMTDMFFGLALPGARQGGDAAAVQLRSWSIAIDTNIIEV